MRRLLVSLAVAAALATASNASAGTTFVVDGHGWGHGIGMSQYGAYGYALHGWGYQRILAHYYARTRLGLLPNRIVRVVLAESAPRLVVGSTKPFRRIARRKPLTVRAGGRILTPAAVRKLGGAVRFEPGASPLRVEGRAYRGAITVYSSGGSLSAVNELSLDHYLRGVVPREMPHDWPRAALEAQAVVARSYTLATLHPQQHFDLYADTRDQVYDGIEGEKPESNRAVAATAGRIVTYDGRVATTYYHSTSGGRTANIEDVWPNAVAVPYLRSAADPYDYLSKHHTWPAVVFSRSELTATLKAPGLRDVLVERNASGRAGALRLVAARSTRLLPGQDARVLLGLRSTYFDVRVLALDPAPKLVPRGKPLELTGFVRGLGRIRLGREVAAGAWRKVRDLRLAPNGRFRTVVRPESATRYRLANHIAVGGDVVIVVR
jgi:stage II sporulation protein D